MDVTGLVLSSIGFVDLAIKAGTALAQHAQNYKDAGDCLVSAYIRLQHQKLTVERWSRTWEMKAPLTVPRDEGYRRIWGVNNHHAILECLNQVQNRLRQSQKLLSDIDPNSFTSHANLDPNLRIAPPPSNKASASPGHWRARLPSFMSLRRTANQNPPASLQTQAQLQATLASSEIRENISAMTKTRWSLVVKEELTALLWDTDEWLRQLHTLSKRSAEETSLRNCSTKPYEIAPRVRAAAKNLYTAIQTPLQLTNLPATHYIDFKLERERTDFSYYANLFGTIPSLGNTNESIKFPLYVRNFGAKASNFFLLAEAREFDVTTQSMIGPCSPGGSSAKPFGEIISCLVELSLGGKDGPEILQVNDIGFITIHRIPDPTLPISNAGIQTTQCSLHDFLEAHKKVDPFISSWKRLQLACTISISVLHLYETGWIQQALHANDIHFYGPPESQCASKQVSPFVSVNPTFNPTSKQKGKMVSPFDCLRDQGSLNLLDSMRPEIRLSDIFHHLGVILFEIGRGTSAELLLLELGQGHVLSQLDLKDRLFEEIEKIDLGYSKPYKELVKACLAGRICANPVGNVDEAFHRTVVEK